VAKIYQNARGKKRLVKAFLEKNGFKRKGLPYFDLNKALNATHAMHGMYPLLLAL
jgi:hypothetical protein